MKRLGAPLLAAGAAMLLLVASTRPGPPPPFHDARLSYLRGMTVQDPNAEALGAIKDFVLDAASARVEYAVVGAGGVLGLGGQSHALPVSTLSMATILHGILSTRVTRQQWRSYPAFDGNVAALPAPPPSGAAAAAPGRAAPGNAPPPPGRLELASNLVGSNVVNRQHQSLGTISDLLLDLERQKPAMALVRTRKFLTWPQTFAVPLPRLSRGAADHLVLDVSPQFLEQAPVLSDWAAAAGQVTNAIYRVPGSTET